MGRGKSAKTLGLIAEAQAIFEERQPCTIRHVCYQLCDLGLIRSMKKNETNKVSKHLVWARENDLIPWEWVVDEIREAEHPATWKDPEAFADAALRSFRRDRWDSQPIRVEVWSEKGTVRGTLAPVLREYGVTFRVFHGYNSATVVHQIANEQRDKPVVVFYVGDFDPSGLHMAVIDLPDRLTRYGAESMSVLPERIALLEKDLSVLRNRQANPNDPRYKWFVKYTGQTRAWELDAMDPRNLRSRVEQEIVACIADSEAWHRTELTEQAEQESLRLVLSRWPNISRQASEYGETP